ncbi:hypothetical protein Athai_09460 [Actinocatenispora thailandica]|uniref:Suppressor of fused-like domain-containing protein n=1 Tax=Actinocatenispora thailandica TaxID=227318 RepID=A0A7R7HVU8_9ACTN|nr:suppressor of fused domain protein [Actinocatenispora thailandica]BCJ33443.1 hypothetical protein Athai_09460 [Actinocatenispora thailandica]
MAGDEVPGWDAIDGALARLYGDAEPRHYGTLVKWRLGGPDPLDGISAYPRADPVPHWHLVSYGMTELYEKESSNADESGWGFEFTFRVARGSAETEPPAWALNVLQNLARYVFKSGNWFEPGHHLNLNGPIALDRPDTLIRAVAFVEDPELPAIDTPHGRVRFLQLVGLTLDELTAAELWRVSSFLDLLGPRLPSYVTDLDRPSALDDPATAAAAAAGSDRDGSFTGSEYLEVGACSVAAGVATLTIGAIAADTLRRMIPARLGHGRPLVLHGPGQPIRLEPGVSFGIDVDDATLVLTLPPAAVTGLAGVLRPVAGDHPVPGFPLTVHVERSEIRSATSGEVVRTIG